VSLAKATDTYQASPLNAAPAEAVSDFGGHRLPLEVFEEIDFEKLKVKGILPSAPAEYKAVDACDVGSNGEMLFFNNFHQADAFPTLGHNQTAAATFVRWKKDNTWEPLIPEMFFVQIYKHTCSHIFFTEAADELLAALNRLKLPGMYPVQSRLGPFTNDQPLTHSARSETFEETLRVPLLFQQTWAIRTAKALIGTKDCPPNHYLNVYRNPKTQSELFAPFFTGTPSKPGLAGLLLEL
jgi:hypothetical protein